jgi:potassium efflux system protein
MKTLRVSRRAVLSLAVLTALAWPASARAQGIFGSTTQAPPAQQDTVAAGPQAIPMSEIPLKVDEALARLQTIETQLSVDPDLALIEEDLPDELLSVSRAHDHIRRIVLENRSLRELWNLNAVWHSHEERLARWANDFDSELQEVARVAEAGRRIRETWRLTSESLSRGEDVPQPLVDEANRVLLGTDSLEAVVRTRLSYLLGVKSELDDGLEGVRHVLAELEAARASVRGRMLTRTAPPLWTKRAIGDASTSGVTARIWSEEREAVIAFTAANPGSLLLGAFLFLLFALLLVRLRDRLDHEADPTDESMRDAAETLNRPVSAAILLTILAWNALSPRTPFVLLQAISIAAIVPMYRLLPPSKNPVINRTVRVLLILVAFMAVVELLVPLSFLYRLLGALAALGLVGASGWLLRSADAAQMRQSGWGIVVWRGLQVSLVAGAVSFAANVSGWTLLGETLLGGVMYSAFLGLGVVIGYRVLAGMIRLLPRTVIGQASHIMRGYGDLVTKRAIAVLKIGAVVVWIRLALEALEVIDPLGKWVAGLLTGEIRIGELEFSLEKVFSFVAVILLAIWIARLVAFVLDVEILPRLKLKRGASNAISTVVQWTILGAGLLTAGSALGLQAGQLAIVFGALSVGIGFGLQNIVSNFVSGLILIFEQPVKVGDKVEITSLALTGEVRRIGIRASVVRTFDGAEVIVPNGNLISSEVVNWTLSDQRRRVRVEVGVAYGTDPHRVMEVLKAVAVAHPEVLKYPEPAVVFLEFAQSSLNFRLMFWTATFDDFFRVRSEVYVAVNDALKEEGITIPFPQRDLHVKSLPQPPSISDIESTPVEGTEPDGDENTRGEGPSEEA